jgi:hypothetical protein
MRSKLVFRAITQVPNRFLLVKLASKATRALHRPNSRVQMTMNDVFVRISQANRVTRVRHTETIRWFDRVGSTEPHSHCMALMHWRSLSCVKFHRFGRF